MKSSQHYKDHLSKNIVFIVKSRGLVYSKIARAIGISRKTLQNWSAGETPRDLIKLQLLADHLELSLEAILWTDLSEREPDKIAKESEFIVTIEFLKTANGDIQASFRAPGVTS